MTTAALAQFARLPIEQLKLSDMPAQVERRKRFDKASLAELAKSIEATGVHQPIIVRKQSGHYQVVAGERRVLAAKRAGLKEVPAMVREITSDVEAIEIQLIENLQREDLHELVEAEGYETLQKEHHFTVEQIAAKVGKSIASVYARLKLTALCPEARKAFSEDKISASIALLVARIPVHDLQRRCLKEIAEDRFGQGPMSFRDAKDHIHDKYMLRLDQAPFPTDDAELVLKAGPCGSCPKRTGNQPELFGDVSRADTCTDPVCFAGKKKAHLARVVDDAKAKGKTVIGGAEAKKIAPHGASSPYYSHLNGYTKLSDRCGEDKKGRTYNQVIGKDVEVQHLLDSSSGKLVPVATNAAVAAALAKKGFKKQTLRGTDPAAEQRQRAKQEQDEQVTARVFKAIYASPPKKLGRSDLDLIAQMILDSMGFSDALDGAIDWGFARGSRGKGLKKLSDAQMNAFLILSAIDNNYGYGSLKEWAPIAKRLGVDVEKIKRTVEAEAKAKPDTKKAKGEK